MKRKGQPEERREKERDDGQGRSRLCRLFDT